MKFVHAFELVKINSKPEKKRRPRLQGEMLCRTGHAEAKLRTALTSVFSAFFGLG